jgi:hypothetical protein
MRSAVCARLPKSARAYLFDLRNTFLEVNTSNVVYDEPELQGVTTQTHSEPKVWGVYRIMDTGLDDP